MNSKDQSPTDYRSAKTGQYVTRSYAEHHPATTIREHNRMIRMRRGKK